MRIYSNPYELMSETARNLYEMGQLVLPKTYQNKIIEGNSDYATKELICEQYCLTSLKDDDSLPLFVFDRDSIEWTKQELIERWDNQGSIPINPGEAYKIREDLWKQFLNKEGKFDYTYNERFHYRNNRSHNMDRIIQELIKNPDTRQAVLPVYSLDDVANIGGVGRVPCTMYYDFLIRNVNGEKQLNICYHQRSSDFVTHFGNDVWLAWKTMEVVASNVGVKPGYLYHTIDSLHSYAKDWDKLKTPINQLLIQG